MPKLDDSKVQDRDLYGVEEIDNNLTMGERLRTRFRSHDTVQVLNIDDEPIEWQWLSEDDETYMIDDSNVKIVERERPGLWRLGSGDTDILEGACAYLMIEALFKKMAVKRTGVIEHPLDERDIKNFSFDDPTKQEEFINRIFRGKISPSAMQKAAITQLGGETTSAKQAKPKVATVTE